ncbi:MAG: ROK family protein [Candidatus Aminicenantes bacterium]|nr:MAG: ROK family protein [Candidatus Aminicenantes bacterium]
MPIFAGFDLGGTNLKYGLTDSTGKIIFSSKTATPPSIKQLLEILKKLWNDLKKKETRKVAAIGFGFPGIFSLDQQRILQSPNYAELDNFDLLPALSEFIEVPFWVNNDANMAAFGEYKCGAGQGAHSLIFLTIGTGLGAGIILDGKLWRGKCGFAGELGHVTVNPEGEKCNCGGQGCLETEVSAPKIVRNYNVIRKKDEEISGEEVFARAKKGEMAARQAFAQAGHFLGIGLGIAMNLLNPDKILLGGAVMSAGDLLLSPAIEEVKKRAYKASYQCCKIEKASLGNKAGFLGAALWAKEQTVK